MLGENSGLWFQELDFKAMTEQFAEMKCQACRGGESAAGTEEIARWREQVPEWKIVKVEGTPRLCREFGFPDFRKALDFTIRVGELAEREYHHPEIVTGWGKVKVSWWTHKIGGLHRNDFIMAAKTDALAREG
jgi:4a-hydroxytetrahydrobiopterin dehydratase